MVLCGFGCLEAASANGSSAVVTRQVLVGNSAGGRIRDIVRIRKRGTFHYESPINGRELMSEFWNEEVRSACFEPVLGNSFIEQPRPSPAAIPTVSQTPLSQSAHERTSQVPRQYHPELHLLTLEFLRAYTASPLPLCFSSS